MAVPSQENEKSPLSFDEIYERTVRNLQLTLSEEEVEQTKLQARALLEEAGVSESGQEKYPSLVARQFTLSLAFVLDQKIAHAFSNISAEEKGELHHDAAERLSPRKYPLLWYNPTEEEISLLEARSNEARLVYLSFLAHMISRQDSEQENTRDRSVLDFAKIVQERLRELWLGRGIR